MPSPTSMPSSASRPGKTLQTRRPLALWQHLLLGLGLGFALGVLQRYHIAGFDVPTEPLAELGRVVIRLLKLLAVPLVALSVFDALLRFDFPPSTGRRLVSICAVNAAVGC